MGLSQEENVKVQEKLFGDHEAAIYLEDLCTVNHRAYKEENKTSIKRFRELMENGGFVCAEYQALSKMIIGRVEEGSEIKCGEEFYFLKCLPVSGLREVSPSMRLRLLAGAPKKSGLSRWHVIGTRLEDLIRKKIEEGWDWLLPFEQETVCQEFLRRHFKLLYLLLPFGANVGGIDIYGITDKGQKIYSILSHSDDQDKLRAQADKLLPFDGLKVIFCPESEAAFALQKNTDIEFVWTDSTVWKWLNAARNRSYKNQLFAGV